MYLKNSRIIGRQDTLYVQGAGNRVYVDGGYIEGTVDFVFGDANAYFACTELHMAAFAWQEQRLLHRRQHQEVRRGPGALTAAT